MQIYIKSRDLRLSLMSHVLSLMSLFIIIKIDRSRNRGKGKDLFNLEFLMEFVTRSIVCDHNNLVS